MHRSQEVSCEAALSPSATTFALHLPCQIHKRYEDLGFSLEGFIPQKKLQANLRKIQNAVLGIAEAEDLRDTVALQTVSNHATVVWTPLSASLAAQTRTVKQMFGCR